MIEPWFPPEVARSFAFLSLLALSAGLTVFAKRGQHRAAVMAAAAALVAVGAAMLIAGVIALMLGQPAFVSGPLLLAGAVVTIVCASGLFQLRQMYAESELRRMTAKDL
jgi:fatty acid desaturase